MARSTLTLILASALLLGASVSALGSSSAHTCETVNQKHDVEGCNAHSCPEDGVVHDHWHDTSFWDWTQTDHGCTSDGKTNVFGGSVGVPSVDRCALLGLGDVSTNDAVIECGGD